MDIQENQIAKIAYETIASDVYIPKSILHLDKSHHKSEWLMDSEI
jgi:hypothetical protein